MTDPSKADLIARLQKIQSVGGSLLSNATAALKAAEALVPDPAGPPVVDPPVESSGCPAPVRHAGAVRPGPDPSVALTPVSGGLVVKTGQSLSGLDVQGSVTVQSGGSITDFKARGVGESDWILTVEPGGSATFGEVGGGADGKTFSNAIGVLTSDPSNMLDSLDVHHTSDGFRNDGTTVTNTWVHDLKLDGGVHSDGSQSTQQKRGGYVQCTIEGGNNDAIFIQACAGFTVDSCLLLPVDSPDVQSSYGIGGGNAQCLGPIVFTNNIFGGATPADGKQGSFQVGCIQQGTWPAGTVISGNTMLDGTPI